MSLSLNTNHHRTKKVHGFLIYFKSADITKITVIGLAYDRLDSRRLSQIRHQYFSLTLYYVQVCMSGNSKTNESMDSLCVPVHPLPPGLALPSPLKPDGHVQVKLPTVFIQVAPSTQSLVLMVHSLMSEIMTVVIHESKTRKHRLCSIGMLLLTFRQTV